MVSLEPPTPSSPRRAALGAACQLWLLEVLVLALVTGRYVATARPDTLLGWLFVHGGRLSCAASLSLLPGLLGLAWAALVRRRVLLALLQGATWSLALFLVYLDTRIYGLFRYHFNGLVWNVLTTPGADEAVQLSARDVAGVLVVFGGLVPLQAWVFARLRRWTEALAARRARMPFLVRPGLAWGFVLVPNMVLVAGIYAWGDLARDPRVMAYARAFPLYPRLTIKRFARDHLGVEIAERPTVDLPEEGIQLSYPHTRVRLPPEGPRRNVLVVVIDSLRADMLTPEVMPRTAALARSARVFHDHLSSGNATRFGLFGLVYGLHGSYWRPIYHEHRSPVLVDALLEAGYAFRVLTSASMDFPEFRSTAWVRIEDAVEDRLPTERPGGRDDGVARRFEEWLGERPGDRPFFAFLLLDAPHQVYHFPADCTPFEPYLDSVQYAALDEDVPAEVRTGLFNRYRNAVHYADRTTGRVLDALAQHGLVEDTLVVVTGDHGEEFFEHGLWGHTSTFTRPQVHVPLVLAGPGVPPGEERRPTCHIDLPATLLELLGVDPALRQEWSLGASLLDPPAQRARVVSGWDTLGLDVGDAILEIPMATYGGTDIAVRDASWQPIFDDRAILEREGRALGRLALECARFMR